jgi:2-iminobutanoate/2-iminopropanoate deaminase
VSKTRTTYSFGAETGVPPQVGPFSHATRWGDMLFVTGQMPTDPTTGQLVDGGFAEQAEQVRANLEAVLRQFDATLDDSLMVRVYLEDFDRFAEFNTLYTTWFDGIPPSRTCIGSNGLAVGAAIEIDLVVGLRENGIS